MQVAQAFDQDVASATVAVVSIQPQSARPNSEAPATMALVPALPYSAFDCQHMPKMACHKLALHLSQKFGTSTSGPELESALQSMRVSSLYKAVRPERRLGGGSFGTVYDAPNLCITRLGCVPLVIKVCSSSTQCHVDSQYYNT
jgi:hypothetical protein